MVTGTPVSLDGTQFCAIIATLKLGMKQGLQGQIRAQRQGDFRDNCRNINGQKCNGEFGTDINWK